MRCPRGLRSILNNYSSSPNGLWVRSGYPLPWKNKISEMPYPRANKDNQILTPRPASPWDRYDNTCAPRDWRPSLESSSFFKIKDGDIHLSLFQATPQLDYCFMCSLSSISKLLARNLVDFRLDFPSRSPATWRMDYFLSKLWNDIRGGIDRRSFKGEFKWKKMEEVVIIGFALFSRIFNCEHLERTVDPMGSLHNNFFD